MIKEHNLAILTVMNTNRWIKAFRPRTLPLAFSCIIVGSGLAMADGQFKLRIFVLALVTTLFLQTLSNLANDYGDYVRGTDNKLRVGPERTLQSGLISPSEMVKAMWVNGLLCSILGGWLIYEGTLGLDLIKAGLFVILGLVSMIGALNYTMGNHPYGYTGLGDISVFLFFGWLGVIGSYFLHCQSLRWELLLPASSIGLFTAAVLNINNMRDYETDKRSGKYTVVVRIGIDKAKKYHQILVFSGLILAVAYVTPNSNVYNYLFIATVPLFVRSAQAISKTSDPINFDPFLKRQVITTLLFATIFVVGLNM